MKITTRVNRFLENLNFLQQAELLAFLLDEDMQYTLRDTVVENLRMLAEGFEIGAAQQKKARASKS